MTTNFDDIIQFHEHFRLTTWAVPGLLTDDLFEFRAKFLQEELLEFVNAHTNSDLVKAADALLDLVYVAMGTAYLMGLPWNQLWSVVHAANMTKVRADDLNPSKRGVQAFDIVKPPNWISPEPVLEAIIRQKQGEWR